MKRIPNPAWLVALAAVLLACTPVHEEPRWVGLTEPQLVAELGAPSSASVLSLSRGMRLREEQSGLARLVPATEGARVDVKELRWRHLTHTSAAWLVERSPGSWIVVETLVWRADVRF